MAIIDLFMERFLLNNDDKCVFIELFLDNLIPYETTLELTRLEGLLSIYNQPIIIVDIDKSNYIDSVGIGMIIGMHNIIAKKHKQMYVKTTNENILKVFEMTKIKSMLNIISSRQDVAGL